MISDSGLQLIKFKVLAPNCVAVGTRTDFFSLIVDWEVSQSDSRTQKITSGLPMKLNVSFPKRQSLSTKLQSGTEDIHSEFDESVLNMSEDRRQTAFSKQFVFDNY